MAIGKYITNAGVLSTVFVGFGVLKQTRNMPRDWRRYLVWGSWISSLVMAIASVSKAESDKEWVRAAKGREKEAKREQKARKKALKKM